MKHSVTAAVLSLSFIAVSCYENELQELGSIVDNIESEKNVSAKDKSATL